VAFQPFFGFLSAFKDDDFVEVSPSLLHIFSIQNFGFERRRCVPFLSGSRSRGRLQNGLLLGSQFFSFYEKTGVFVTPPTPGTSCIPLSDLGPVFPSTSPFLRVVTTEMGGPAPPHPPKSGLFPSYSKGQFGFASTAFFFNLVALDGHIFL